jgi:WD40 repeat protein
MKSTTRLGLIVLALCGVLTGCVDDKLPTEEWMHSELGSYAAAFSPDRRFVLVGDTDLPAKLWDIEANKIQYSWQNVPGDSGTTTSVGFSGDGKVVATCESDTFVLWNAADGEPMVRLSFPYKVRDFALSPKGDYLLVALADRTAVYFDVIENRVVHIFEHDGSPVGSPINQLINTVALSPDGKWALTGGDDRTARLWDLETGEEVHQWLHGNVVSLVSFHPTSAYAITSGANDHTVFRNITKPTRYVVLNKTQFDLDSMWAQLPVFKTTTSAIAYSPDGKLIATGHPNQMICVWATNGKNLGCWNVPRKNALRPGVVIQSLAFSADGKYIYSEAGNGLGQKWRVQ